MSSTNQLRNLPAVDEVLRCDEVVVLLAKTSRNQILKWVREAIDGCRDEICNGHCVDADEARRMVIATVLRCAAQDGSRRLQSVINATGILLHTNLGRAPLAEKAVQRIHECSDYANVELNLVSGLRSGRGERVCELLARLAGAESALVVNNCAAATMLVLQMVANGCEVIVSRGQLVEIGGGFRLPEVFEASGAVLREVGTTNRTYLRDYESAINEKTAAIIRVHRSNFYQGGFTSEPGISELVSLCRSRGLPVIDDIGSGCVCELPSVGQEEPVVQDSVAAGADLVLFSGDKLFGGPQAGIIVGAEKWISALRCNPMMRALRVDKLVLAAIEATAEIHLSGRAADELPLLQMLSVSAEAVRQRCQKIVSTLHSTDEHKVAVCECVAQVGGGSVPGSQLPSFGIRISGGDVEKVAHRLRMGIPAVLGRVQDDSVVLDLRSVAETQLSALTVAIQSAIVADASNNE